MHHGTISPQIAKGLKVLQSRIDKAKIPSSKIDETLNIATWNIREFGKTPRKEASIHYIAEILGQFDLVAVAELRDNLADLSKVLPILGPYWHAVYSDYMTDAGGNRERMAYIFDKRAVTFTGLASEVDALRKKNSKTGEYETLFSWWRAPYIASFRSGDFDFIVATVHIRWGEKEEDRINELKLLADWVDQKVKEKTWDDKDIILVGDFNIPAIGDKLYQAVTLKGLKAPDSLLGTHGSNLEKDKRYDQILHLPRFTKCFTNLGGVVDFYANEHQSLFPGDTMTKQEFTFQLSDHLPLWAQIDTDIDGEVIDQIIKGG